MPNFNIVRTAAPQKTFRVASVMGMFDLQSNSIKQRFVGNIDIPEKWQVGLIVGNSGSGKTTIAKELFPEFYLTNFDYSHETILDDMPMNCKVNDIVKTFNSVGFSSPPSWLKPYSVLSNGEKMRCDLARAILSENKMFVFDEFTSVVDRNVAKIGSYAVQKALRRRKDKQMIAVTCHFDVEEWLQPDWVFNTNDMTFRLVDETQKKNKPKIEFSIYKINKNKRDAWRMFAPYHYLSENFNPAADVFVGVIEGNIVAFNAILPFLHPRIKNVRRGHRLVVLPDYQGIGLGVLFSDAVAEMYKQNGYSFVSVTSNPALINACKKSRKWIATRIMGRVSKPGGGTVHNSNNISCNRYTCSFKYVGDN